MAAALLDLSFLYQLASNDSVYIYEVIVLYLKNVPDSLSNLERLVKETNDFDAIQKQAHALKSSAGIIKVRDMYDSLVAIETIAREHGDQKEIRVRFDALI